MSLTFYERVGHERRRPSPFSWRIRFSLAHKGLEPDVVPMRFADVETVRSLSGQPMVPVIDHDGHVVADSWAIAAYLDDAYPDRPSLFGGALGRATTHFLSRWADEALHPAIRMLIYPEFSACLDAGDRAYFRETREAMLGCRLEDLAAARPAHEAELIRVLAPMRATLEHQPYLCGDAPAYGDYAVFGAFQWARLGCPRDVLPADDPLRPWRQRMVALYDGLADRFPGYPED